MLNMVDRLAYIRSLASKYNLKESIKNSYGSKVYIYYLNPICNNPILWLYEEDDYVRMATELRTYRDANFDDKKRLYVIKFLPEYSTRNIERRLAYFIIQTKEFKIKMKKQDIENDFK